MNENKQSIEEAAKAIYGQFPFANLHPWVDGGNSIKQDEARSYARAAFAQLARQEQGEAIAEVSVGPASRFTRFLEAAQQLEPGIYKLYTTPQAQPAAPTQAAPTCWSCKKPYTLAQRADADGNCPHCGVEIELEEPAAPSVSEQDERAWNFSLQGLHDIIEPYAHSIIKRGFDKAEQDRRLHAIADYIEALFSAERAALPQGAQAAQDSTVWRKCSKFGHRCNCATDCDPALPHPSVAAHPAPSAAPAQPQLTVWHGPMPESNGKSNFTAILMRKGASIWQGPSITIGRSEYPDRVRYEADRARYLIGELAERPSILDYDADKHSGYIEPERAAPAQVAQPAHETIVREGSNLVCTACGTTAQVQGEPVACALQGGKCSCRTACQRDMMGWSKPVILTTGSAPVAFTLGDNISLAPNITLAAPVAPSTGAQQVRAQEGKQTACRMRGGMCTCRSGGSSGGCAMDRAAHQSSAQEGGAT